MELDKSKTNYTVRLSDGAPSTTQPEHQERNQLINTDDLLVLANYLTCLPVAWALPERWWPSVAKVISFALAPINRSDDRDTRQAIRSIFGARLPASSIETLPLHQRAMALVEAMQHLRSYRPGGWFPRIEVIGTQHIDDALSAGSGAVLWITDFIFSTLVTKIALSRAGYRITHLSRPSHPLSQTKIGRRLLNPIVTRLETRYLEQRVIVDDGQLIGGIRVLIRKLRANGLISFTVDNQSSQTIQVPILDGYIQLAKGAPRLAAAASTPLLPVFTLRRDDGSFVTRIDAPIEFARNVSPEEAAADAMRGYAKRLEPLLIDAPHLWYDWSGSIRARPAL